MVHKYEDRSESDIYERVNKKFDVIKNNGNRDDEDVYVAAMSTVADMLEEDRKEFEMYGHYGDPSHPSNRNFVFDPYIEFYEQLKKEHDALEANGTNHYPWSKEAEHMQKVAGRINDVERATLIRRNVHDAKYELVYGDMVDCISIPGDNRHSYVNTPPILTEKANGKNFSEVLKDIEKHNKNLTKGMTYTLEISNCKITVGPDGLNNGEEVKVNEGVKIYSNKYIEALEAYENYQGYEKYNTPGYLDKENNRLRDLLDLQVKNPKEYKRFDEMLFDAEKIPEYGEAVKILFKNKKLFGAFQSEFANGNREFALEFLAASEAKLDYVVSKAKQIGASLCEDPIATHSPGIIQANFVGEKGSFKEYFFWDGINGRQGQLCKISKKLYDFLAKNNSALEGYFTERIKQRRGENKYVKIELTERIVDENETTLINKETYANKYGLRTKGITNLIQLCRDFANSYGDSDDYQPAQLVKIQNYLNNLLRDVNKLYENRKWINDKQWKKIVTNIQKLWIDIKNHDGKRASMSDKTACDYIYRILNAGKSSTIDINSKKLVNGMTVLDNTMGKFAVDNLVQDGKNSSGNDELHLVDENKDKEGHSLDFYWHKINQDFNVKVDENGNVSNNKATDNLIKARETDSGLWNESYSNPTGILKYLKKNNYLPEYADLGNDKIKKACQNIHEGMTSKIDLLNKSERKIDKIKMKERLITEQESLKKRSNLSDKEINYVNGINVLINDDNELNNLIAEQNAGMERSIRYGDMQAMIADSFDDYFVKEGGGVKGGDGDINDVINDSYGTGGRLDFSDETCETMGNIIGQIAIEIAICAVAMAAGAVTGGAGSAAILAIRGAVMGGRIARIIGGLRRIKLIANLCKRTCTGAKYIRGLATRLKNSKWFKIMKTGTPAASESTTHIPVISTIIEGAGFHVADTVLHNAIRGKPLTEGLDLRDIPNQRGLIESIAFFGILKMVGAPIQNLTKAGLNKILSEKAMKTTLGKAFGTGLSIGGEIISLQLTGQALNLAFDHELKDITVEEVIHTLGMVLGLRIVNKIKGKIIIKMKTAYEIEYEVPGEGTYKAKYDKNKKLLEEPKLIKKTKQGNKDIKNNESEAISGFIKNIASDLHEEWRKTRLKEDNTYEPRIEKTKDNEWIKKHGTDEVDIANTKFEDLPSDWQSEDLEAAKVAVSLVYEIISKGEQITPKMVEEMSNIVHEKWLERNGKEGSFESQRVDYKELSEEEKSKDRNQVLDAIEKIGGKNMRDGLEKSFNNDYFGGKSHEFDITEDQAISNSESMDKLLEEITEQNKKEKLEALRKQICEQYKKVTKEDLKLTEDQLLSILDAHEQDGILGQLTTKQLKQKVKVLDETIKDDKVRRFLLESGFCGSLSDRMKNFGGEIHEQYFGFGTKLWIPVWKANSHGYSSVCGEVIRFDGKSGKYTFRRYDLEQGRRFNSELTKDQFLGIEQPPCEPGTSFWIPRGNGSMSLAQVIEFTPGERKYRFSRYDGDKGNRVWKPISENELYIQKPKYDGTEEVLIQFNNGETIKVKVTGYNPSTREYTVMGQYKSITQFWKVSEQSLDNWNKSPEDPLLGTTQELQDSNGNKYTARITQHDKVNKRYRIERTDEYGNPRSKVLSYEELRTERQNYVNNNLIGDYNVGLDEVVVTGYRRVSEKKLNELRKGIKDKNTEAYYKIFRDIKNIIDYDGQTFYTTDCLIDSRSGYKFVVGFVNTSQGTKVRLFYRSKSEGARRSCPGHRGKYVDKDGKVKYNGYSKGEFITDSSYETTTRPCRELQNELNKLREVYMNEDPIKLIDVPNFLGNEMVKETTVIKLFRGENNTVDYLSKMSSAEQAKNFYAGLGKELDISGMKIVEGGLDTYEHDTLGTIELQVCSVNLGGREYHISFGRAINDPLKQVRIEEVTDPQAKTNSFGLPNISVNAAPLTGKPIDYISQVPGNMRTREPIDQKRKQNSDGVFEQVNKGKYIDIREIYQDNPFVKKFKILAGLI